MKLNCEALKNIVLPGSKIVEMTHVDRRYIMSGSLKIETIRPFLRLKVECKPSDDSLIYFELWLPDEWNGLFVGTGNGGMAGSINLLNMSRFLPHGYAVANTDMGTSRGVECGVKKPEVWKDFGWRATHRMTVDSKKVIEAYYGKKPEYSYFLGESTGGQQAIMEAQRFPEDYDGIFAGVPAHNRTNLHTYALWSRRHLHRPDGSGFFTEEQVSAITEAAVRFFQKRGDGQPGDWFVSFPYTDENTIEEFLADLQVQEPEFSPEQIDALRAVYQGPRNPKTGEQIYCGIPIGAEDSNGGFLGFQKPFPKDYPFIWAFGEEFDPMTFDFAEDMEELRRQLSEDLDAINPDLSAFFARGGKLLSCSGSSDTSVPFPDAQNYYEAVLEKMGGYEKVSEFYRWFLSPGKDHNHRGRGAQMLFGPERNSLGMLQVLRAWREEGVAPDQLLAVRFDEREWWMDVNFVREIYPYGSKQNPRRRYPASCDLVHKQKDTEKK